MEKLHIILTHFPPLPQYGFSLTFSVKLFMDWVRPAPIYHKRGEFFRLIFFVDLARPPLPFMKFSIFCQIFFIFHLFFLRIFPLNVVKKVN